MTKQPLLSPTNDYVFGRIFGYKGNENITHHAHTRRRIFRDNIDRKIRTSYNRAKETRRK